MAYACDLCGKTALYGRQGRHHKGVAGGKWKKRAPKTRKVFLPNLHWAKIAGVRLRLCTKCLRLMKGRVGKKAQRARKAMAVAGLTRSEASSIG